MITPQQLRAEVPEAQMDGVMGQSIKEEMDDTQISDVDTQRDGLLSTYAMPRLLGHLRLHPVIRRIFWIVPLHQR